MPFRCSGCQRIIALDEVCFHRRKPNQVYCARGPEGKGACGDSLIPYL